MTKKEAVLSWLNWLRRSVENTIEIAELDVTSSQPLKRDGLPASARCSLHECMDYFQVFVQRLPSPQA